MGSTWQGKTMKKNYKVALASILLFFLCSLLYSVLFSQDIFNDGILSKEENFDRFGRLDPRPSLLKFPDAKDGIISIYYVIPDESVKKELHINNSEKADEFIGLLNSSYRVNATMLCCSEQNVVVTIAYQSQYGPVHLQTYYEDMYSLKINKLDVSNPVLRHVAGEIKRMMR